MTTAKRVLSEGKGLVFIPLVFRYSLAVSGLGPSDFERSSGRAQSIYSASKALGSDGVISEIDAGPSLTASGLMRAFETDQENSLRADPEVSRALETTKRLSQLIARGGADKEVMSVIYGQGFLLRRNAPEKDQDIEAFVDNMAVLERLFLENGSTSILLIEESPEPETLPAYRTLGNVAKLHGATISLASLGPPAEEMLDQAKGAGFDFAGGLHEEDSDDKSTLRTLRLDGSRAGAALTGGGVLGPVAVVEGIRESCRTRPVVLLTEGEPSPNFPVAELLRVVKALGAG